jgi:hypothetical protein
LYFIVSYSYLIIPLCFLLFKGKLKDRIPSVLALYGLLFCVWLIYYKASPKDIRKYLQVAYTFLEYSFFTFIFWYNIRNKGFKIFILGASLMFIAFQIFFISSTTFIRLDSIPIGIETIFLFIYIFYFFFEFSKQIKDTFIYNHYTFWVAVGIMIYLGGSFFFYILINHLDTNEVEKFGKMTYIAEIVKNLLFAFSIYVFKKHPNKIHNNLPKKIPNLDMI